MRIDPITEKEWIGLTLTEAIEKANNIGYTHRIVEQNGKHMMLGMDVKSNRINLRVYNEVVTAAYTG